MKARESEVKKVEEEAVLKRGPEGAGRLSGGVLVVLDGQKVERDSKGVLCISCERSPYNGLPTTVYFEEIVIPWKRQNAKLQRDAIREARRDPNYEPDGSFKLPRAPWPECPPDVPRPGAEGNDGESATAPSS